MKSYLRHGYSGFRVTAGIVSFGIALFFSGMAQAAPQYDIACDTCHRMPPLDSATGTREPATGAFKGNHQQHSGTTATSCAKCHGDGVTNYQTGHRDKTIQVQGNINNSPKAGGATYSRGFFNQSSVSPSTLGSCSNVNCHFESVTDAWGVSPLSTYTQLGANGTTCGKCHGAPPSDGNHPSAAPGPGKKHGDYYTTGTGSCVKCHPDHAAEGSAAFNHATSAGKRGLLLQFTAAPNSGGSYSGNVSYPAYLPSQSLSRNGNCANLYCHSDGRGNDPKTIPTWGSTLPAECTGCHGGNAGTGSNAIATYQHQKHINNAGFIGTNYACGRCHSNTVDAANDQAINASGVSTYHVNGTPNIAFNNGGTYAGGTCSATLCHSAGKSALPPVAPPNWTIGGALDCKGCHGSGGNYGEPSYTSEGPAADLANSHSGKHVKNAASCADCHANTTVDGVSIKPGSTSHTNGGIDVNFAAGYQRGTQIPFDGSIGQKTCANIYCHSDGNGNDPNQTPQWGGSVTCTSCHGNNATSGSPIASNKHSVHMNNYSTLGRGNNFSCVECHAKTVDSDAHILISGRVNHANKMKDYSGARAGKITVSNSGKCNNNYCHSTGAKNNIFWNMTAANWYSNRTLGCTGCHGNASSADFTPVAGAPNYANITGAVNTARNSHSKHVPGAGITNTTGCAKCHYRTVDAATPNKLRNYSTQHLNGVRDVSFSAAASISGIQGRYSSTTQQCMNTYCHGAPKTPKWGAASLLCNQCHSADSTGFGANAGAHTAHYQAATPPAAGTYASMAAGQGSAATQTSYQFNCTSCHSSPATHANGAANANGVAEVYFGYSSTGKKGTYSYGAYQNSDNGFRWSAGKCSSTYCHSNGNGGFANMTSFTWASPTGGATLGCSGCHGGNAGSGNTINTNKHAKHMNNTAFLGAGNNFACGECHAKSVATGNDAAITNKLNHVNKFKDYSGVKAGGSATYSAQTCSASYCHSSGKKGTSGVSEPANPNWVTGGTLGCDGCHGVGTGTGYPNYANGAPGAANANNHAKHVTTTTLVAANTTGCGVCHLKTVNSGVANKLRDYSSSHLNRSIDVNIAPSVGSGAAYTGGVGNKTCANVYCHSNGLSAVTSSSFTVMSTAKWGATLSCKGCHNYTAASGKPITTNAHGAHINNNAGVVGKIVKCQECHNATTQDSATIANGYAYHVDKNVEVKFENSAGINKDTDLPTYNGARTDTAAAGSAKAAGSATGSCNNVYCHSNGTVNSGSNGTLNAGTPSFVQVAWNATAWGANQKCTSCHGTQGSKAHSSPDVNTLAGAANANNHVKHVEIKGFSCDYCHLGTTTDTAFYPALPAAVVIGGSHLNRTADVSFKQISTVSNGEFTGSYTGTVGTKSCSSTYCHSNGNGGPALKTAQWGDKLNCRGCHGGDAASTTPIASGKHSAHMMNYTTLGRGNNFMCAECHAKTVGFANNTTITNQAKHVNVLKDYSGIRAGKIAAGGKCSNNYCHSTGAKNKTFWNMTAANWYSGRTLGCTGCHGNASSPDFAPVAGAPNYANVTSAVNTARNSHNKHVPGAGITDSTGCAKCHYRTVDAATSGKLRNYSTQHLNGVPDVSFSAAASISGIQGRYSSTTQQCMNTYCHGAPKTPKWGAPSLLCNQCHSADSTGFGANAGAHGAHYQVSTPPAAGTYASMPAGEGSAATQAAYQFNCTSCHKAPATHASGAANANGVAEVYFGYSSAGKKGSYSYGAYQNADNGFRWSAGKCSNTYCHSNGNGGFANFTSFTWASPAGGATLGCSGCHGGSRAGGKPIATGKHQVHMNNYTTLGTTFGCAECHAKTVNSDAAIGNKLLHVNKMKDYSGARAGSSASYGYATGCSATYCHTSGKKGQLTGVSGYTEPTQPKWNDAVWSNKCNGCHGGAGSVAGEPTYTGGAGGGSSANSHSRHVAQLFITNSTGCAVCHRNTVDSVNAWRLNSYSTSTHLNRKINVAFSGNAGAGASYNAGRTCSGVACHSDGNGNYGNPVWGTTLNCASCHPNLSGAHARHMGSIVLSAVPFYAYTANVSSGSDSFTQASYGFGCANCHPTDLTKHNNGSLDIELNASTGAGSLKMKNSAAVINGIVRTGGNVSCTGVYCHSDGRGGANTTPLWNQTFAGLGIDRCAQCHGNSPASGAHAAHVVGIHYNDIFTGTSGKVPQTGSTTVASSHGDPNQSTTLNCNVCHADTITYGRNRLNSACVSCHSSEGDTGLARIGNLTKHVNGSVDIALTNVTLVKSKAQLRPLNFADYTAAGGFWSRNGGNYKNGAAAFDAAKTLAGAPAWEKASSTCSNINCHMGNPVNWNDNKVECVDCHKAL